jgi:hypothetical protein
MIGFGLGGGRAGAPDYGAGAFGWEFHVGGMLTPKLALLFDLSGMNGRLPNQDRNVDHTLAAFAAQYFLGTRVWGKAGVGFHTLFEGEGDAESNPNGYQDTGAGFLLALGAEPLQTTGGFALDLQLRLVGAQHAGDTITSVALLLGFNWY